LPPVRPNPQGEAYPLSANQERLWFVHKLDPRLPLYNISRAYRLTGELDIPTLQRAIDAVVVRHDSLRTRFVENKGVPRQFVVEPATVPLPLLDVSGRPEPEREAQRRMRAAATMPFDLEREGSFRASLYKLGATQHVLVLAMHHIMSDGWSLQVLSRDLTIAYNDLAQTTSGTITPLRRQYADIVALERSSAREKLVEVEIEWWRDQLKGVVPVDVPGDRPRPARRSFSGRQIEFWLPPDVRDDCKRLAQELRVTPFRVVLAAFALTVARYSGLNDVVIGSPFAGRAEQDMEGLIGFFANILALRIDLAGDPSFETLVRRTGVTVQEAMARHTAPFDRIVEAVRPDRDSSVPPLVQVALAYQNVPEAPLSLPGVSVDTFDLHTGTAKFDLTLTLTEHPGGIRGTLEYATDLYDAATASRIAEHFTTLLRAGLAQRTTPVSTLSMLGTEERATLLGFARSCPQSIRRTSIPELFAARAAANPNAVAVAQNGRTQSYGVLNEEARRLAGRLLQAGVARGDRVALVQERSVELVTSMLATLMAGAVYVPLDPAHPPQHLREILDDAGIRIVLVAGGPPSGLPTGVQVIDVRDGAGPGDVMAMAEVVESGPEDPAYVMYTSGTTGRPKGVVVPHRAIAHLVLDTDYAPLDSTDVVAHCANPAFDASTWEVWGALLNGGRLVVVDRDTVIVPETFARALTEHGVTALFLTTALFNVMARDAPGALGGLRYLLFGGEVADPEAVRKLLRAGSPERLLHVYGPTETTTFATFQQVRTLADDAASVPIGRAIAGTEAYLLDCTGEPVPVGVAGDLFIGGLGLALGYLGQPETTAQRFVANPVSEREGVLYRTGDIAKWRFDGAIEFLGRADRQFKVRGFRIEPGAIEAALADCQGISGAAVTVHGTGAERRLIAYAVPAREKTPPARAVVDALRGRLPAYMVPASVTFVDAIPLTANGKTDWQALPAPTETGVTPKALRPRDPLEYGLAELWKELLGIKNVGIRDDFFALGGHSLLAARLVSRIEETYGRRIPLAALFTGSTIEALAKLLREESVADRKDSVVALNAEGTRATLYFFHGDTGGEGLYGITLARHLGADQPLLLIGPTPPLPDGSGPDIPEMARDGLAIIRRTQPEGPYRIGGYCNGGLVAHEVARLLETSGERVDRLFVVMGTAETVYYGRLLRLGARLLRLRPSSSARRLERVAGLSGLLRKLNRGFRSSWARGPIPGAVFALRHAVELPLAIVRRSRRVVAEPESGFPEEPVTSSQNPDYPDYAERAFRLRHMRLAVRAYVPTRYQGRLTLFWTADLNYTPWDPTAGWRKVAREVDVVPIVGDHGTCLTTHLDDLAARIRERLQD